MEYVIIEELCTFSHPLDATDGARALADAPGTTDVAVDHITLAPGEAPEVATPHTSTRRGFLRAGGGRDVRHRRGGTGGRGRRGGPLRSR